MANVVTRRLPGVHSKRTATPRKVLLSDHGALFLPGGVVIDGSKSRDPLNTGDVQYLCAGLLLGKITASGKYAPSILGTLTVAHTSDSATSMTVSAATATELNRRIGANGTFKLTGPPTAGGTVATETITYSAVDTGTGVITITPTSTDFIAGSFLQPADGSETPLGLIGDGYPVKVTDEDESNADVPLEDFLVAGLVDASQIVNWPSDTSLRAWIRDALKAYGDVIPDYAY